MLMEKYDVPLIIMPLTGEFLLTGDEYEHAHGIHCSEEVFKDSLVDYVTLWYGLAILYPEFYVELYRETGLPHKLLDEGSQCQEAFDIAMEIYVDSLTEFAALSGTAEPSNNLGR